MRRETLPFGPQARTESYVAHPCQLRLLRPGCLASLGASGRLASASRSTVWFLHRLLRLVWRAPGPGAIDSIQLEAQKRVFGPVGMQGRFLGLGDVLYLVIRLLLSVGVIIGACALEWCNPLIELSDLLRQDDCYVPLLDDHLVLRFRKMIRRSGILGRF
jgi:hypothetical protein